MSEIEKAIKLLQDSGADVKMPHRTTLLRRAQSEAHVFPVISRSGRSYIEKSGRKYGEVSPSEQRQADAGFWRAGARVRQDCLPMTVAVAGEVKRIYEVLEWVPDGAKWRAVLGGTLTSDQLDANYPGYPYRVGDSCPTRRGGAYRPENY